MRRTLAVALASTALASCGGDGAENRSTNVVETTTTRVEVVEGLGKDGGFDPQAIFDREAPGVVTVISLFADDAGGDLEQRDPGSGLGSGFVISADGEIVTNAHVVTTGDRDDIERAREVYVQFGDGNRVRARIVGQDPYADIALLEVDPDGLELRPLELGSSDEVEVGTPVAAMGSPFGEEQSLSIGVVSAVDRNIGSLTDFSISGAVQTDAAINPGNSGGPLVDAKGRVIGVNQQIRTTSGGGEGVGFAVPVDLVRRSVDQLREDGRVEYAYLGVSSQRVYPQLAERFDLPVERGAWLQEVSSGGPADEAGLRGGGARQIEFQAARWRTGGDVVVRVGDAEIADSGDLAAAIERLSPGRVVEVEYYRGDERRTAEIELGRRPLEVGDRP